MKKLSVILLVFCLLAVACQNKQSTEDKTKIELNSDSIVIAGNWYYTEYTDSTIKYKKIYDYSWTLASLAYEVKIDSENPDSVIFKGYHEGWTSKLKMVSKYTYQTTEDKDQYWTLRFEKKGVDTKLFIKEYTSPTMAHKADPKEYELSRKTLSIKNEEFYFAKNILAGKYTDSKTNITVVLNENLDLIGIDSLNKYSIQIDSWEMVPQMDIITFYGGNFNKHVDYNWKFKDDSLILSSIISLYDNGVKTGPDVTDGDYAGAKIDKVVYRLKKIK